MVATILLVAMTIVVSATAYVMVMSFGGSTSVVPYGAFTNVRTDDVGEYTIVMGPTSSPVYTKDCKLSINGWSSGSLDEYSDPSSPYRAPDGSFEFYVITFADSGRLSQGSTIELKTTSDIGDLEMSVYLVHIASGGAIASTSFLAQGTGSPYLSLVGATAFGAPPPTIGFPMALSAVQRQYVSVPKANVGSVITSISVELRFMLNAKPLQQSPWACLINNDANNGIRLQLSGTADGNDHLEFGIGSTWIRSDGKSDSVSLPALKDIRLAAGYWYTVKISYDTVSRNMQLYINDTDSGVLVLTGQKTHVGIPSLPQNSCDWFIGAWGSTFGSRYFDGTISYIIVRSS